MKTQTVMSHLTGKLHHFFNRIPKRRRRNLMSKCLGQREFHKYPKEQTLVSSMPWIAT